MTNRPIRALLVGAVAVMLLASLAAPAAATTDLTIDASSDLDEGVTVTEFNAADEEAENLVINIDGDAHNLDTAEVEIEYQETEENDDGTTDIVRNFTVYTADLDSTDYAGVSGEDTTDELHTWEINHSSFAEVPVGISGAEDLEATIEIEAEDGTTDTHTFSFSVDPTTDRSVVAVDGASIDDGDIGADAETETVSKFLGDDSTLYHVEDIRDVDGQNTTVEVHFLDADAEDAFLSAAEDEPFIGDAEMPADGEIAFGMAAAADDHDLAPVYMNEAGSEVDEETDTYAVYHEDDGMVEINYGDDYADATSVEPHVGSHSPTDLDPGMDELTAAYGHVGFATLVSEFGVWNAVNVSYINDTEAAFAVVAPLIVTGVAAKRRQGAEVA